jgi:predicted dienelactone hydrolase
MKKAILFATFLFSCVHVGTLMGLADGGEFVRGASADKNVLQDWQDTKRNRTVPVKLYLPTSGSAPYPVVIFSHGLGGSREAAGYLGDCWSQHGYLCVFVQHPGSDKSVWESARGAGRQAILSTLKPAANAEQAVNRAEDIKFVLNELERRNQNDPLLKGKLKLSEIALSGHSFGAGTTLSVAGQIYGQRGALAKDERIKAAIYLCPPVAKGDPEQSYHGINIPGLLLTGTLDDSPINDTKAADRRIPFDHIKGPQQYFVNIIGADHATFGGRAFRAQTDKDEKFHEIIEKVSTEFLDSTLKGDSTARNWLDSKGITSYLGDAARFERK